MNFRTIQGCPVDAGIAPYIAVCVNDAHATVNSIYRGHDAAWILNKHHKHSQDQLWAAWEAWSRHGILLFGFTRENPPNPANPPTMGTHILKGDGTVGKPGEPLEWWEQGFDVRRSDVQRVIQAARRRGWDLYPPYHGASEAQHLNFRTKPARPKPGTLMWARIWRIRLTLPRS